MSPSQAGPGEPGWEERLELEGRLVGYFNTGDAETVAVRESPHELFDEIRAASPLYKTLFGLWMATGYEECRAVTHESKFSNDPRNAIGGFFDRGDIAPETFDRPVFRLADPNLLFNDPPVHSRLRRLVSRSFAPKAVQAREQRVGEIAREVMDSLRDRDSFDFLGDFAFVLSMRVISELFDVSLDNLEEFSRWTEMIISLAEPGRALSPEFLDEADGLAKDAMDFFAGVMEERRARPGQDIISLLFEEAGDSDLVRPEEVVGLLAALHAAGHELTALSLGSTLNLLLQHPDQYAALRANPALWPGAFEEGLRYEPPPRSLVPRFALCDMELGDGVFVAKGETVFPLVSAANRDPRVFEDPHRFDMRRSPNPHLGFGHRVHFCIGAPLARLEARAMFETLLADPAAMLVYGDEPPKWRDTVVVRGLTSLPVAWETV